MFDKIKELVGDNSEALAEIENAQNAIQDSTSTINKLEKTNNDLLVEVKKFKEGNSLVKNELGLDELNADTIKDALSKFKKGDNAEVENLQKQLESVTTDYESKLSEATNKLNGYLMESALSSTELRKQALNDDAFERAKQLALEGSTLDGGNIVFKNEDGTTKYNSSGKVYSLQDRASDILSNPKYLYLFEKQNKPGTGTYPEQGGSFDKKPTTFKEKQKALLENK